MLPARRPSVAGGGGARARTARSLEGLFDTVETDFWDAVNKSLDQTDIVPDPVKLLEDDSYPAILAAALLLSQTRHSNGCGPREAPWSSNT